MNETIELKSGQQGYIEYKSSNPFEFYHILNELDKAPEIDAQGWLIFPEKGEGPFPVISVSYTHLTLPTTVFV